MKTPKESLDIQRAVAKQLQQNADAYAEDYLVNLACNYIDANGTVLMLQSPEATKVFIDDKWYLGEIFKIILSDDPTSIKFELNSPNGMIEASFDDIDLTFFDLAELIKANFINI